MNVIVSNAQNWHQLVASKLYFFKKNSFTKKDKNTVINSFAKKDFSMLKGVEKSFFLYDEKNSQGLLFSDCFSCEPLYYARTSETSLVVSDSIRGVLKALRKKDSLNREFIADYLTYHTASQESTIYQGILKLPAAHYLFFDHSEITIRQYWNGSEEDNLSSGSDLFSLFKANLQEFESNGAVSLGVELSGGLDSSTVAALLPASAKTHYIFSNTSELEDKSQVDSVLKLLPYTYRHHNIFANKPYYFVSHLHQLFAIDKQPSFGGYGLFAEPLLQSAQANGVTHLFSGFGGDQTFSWHNNGFMVSLWKAKQWRKILNLLVKEKSIASFKHLLLSMSWPHKLPVIKRIVQKKSKVKYQRSYIKESFAQKHQQKERMLAVHKTMLCDFYEQKFFLAQRLGHVAKSVESRSMAADKFGISYVFSFLRRSVFNLAQNVPLSDHYDGQTSRKLIKETMKDYLPDAVLKVEVKHMEAIPGLKANFFAQHQEFLFGRIDDLSKNKQINEFVDLPKMRASLTKHSQISLRFFLHAWLMAEFIDWYQQEK